MRIFWDEARQDYRVEIDRNDPNDTAAFDEAHDVDPIAGCIRRHLIQLANHHDPPLSVATRRSWTTALLRMLGFMYGEDLSPDAPNLGRISMRRAAHLLAQIPATEPRNQHDDPEMAKALAEWARNEEAARAIRDHFAPPGMIMPQPLSDEDQC